MKSAATSLPRAKRISSVDGESTVVRGELSLKSLLSVLALIAVLWMLLNLVPVLLVLMAALMTVGALNPLVAWFVKRKMKRRFAIGLVFGLGALATITLATVTIPPLLDQAKTLADTEPRMRESVAGFLERSRLTASLADDLRNVRYTDVVKSSRITLFTMCTGMIETVACGVAAVFLAFYMMIDHDRLRGALFAVVPRRHHLRLSAVLLNLGTIVGDYIRSQALTCLLMSGFILALLLACRVPNALAIAVFGGIMDLLPYIGVFLTIALAVLAASVKGPVIAIIVFALLLAFEELESRVLVPLVYGRALRPPSSVVLFSLIVGTALAGVAGALLAVPIAAAMLMLVKELRVELPGERLQPEDIEQLRKDDQTEREYERRAESMPVAQAAAVAVEISGDRKKADSSAENADAHLIAKKIPAPAGNGRPTPRSG